MEIGVRPPVHAAVVAAGQSPLRLPLANRSIGLADRRQGGLAGAQEVRVWAGYGVEDRHREQAPVGKGCQHREWRDQRDTV